MEIKSKDLCVSCSFAYRRIEDSGDEKRYCTYFNTFLMRRVNFCGQYQDRSVTEQHELEKIAWIINPHKRGSLGFAPPIRKGNFDE